jgi:arylsulfatase A-like enzyme
MYYDEIGRLDLYVGKVLAELERQGALDRTAIVFITDNGRPFPRCKTSVYDSGIRSPLLVRWPGRVKPGSVCGSLVSSVDIAPTLLELAGLPAEPAFQGKSFAGLLADPAATIREHVIAEHNWHDYAACERAARSARFKYIRNAWPDLPGTPPADAVKSITFQEMRRLRDAGELPPEQMACFIKPRASEELYDVEADPQEMRNLAADPAHAATLRQLRDVLDRWQQETADVVPSPRPPDTFDRETGDPLSKPARQR